jgi:hypothetical protein
VGTGAESEGGVVRTNQYEPKASTAISIAGR